MSPAVEMHSLNDTFGVLLIAFIFAVSLYGLTFFQTFLYFSRFPADPVWSRYSIGVLWALDTATTTLLSHTIYCYLISNFLEPFDALTVTRTFVAEHALAAFGIFVVHTFYAFRIRTVNRRSVCVPIVISCVGLVAFALGIAATANLSQQPLFHSFATQTFKILLGMQYSFSTFCDLIIVVALFYLMQPERHPGKSVSTNIFDFGVVHFFNRGTCFTILQAASLITFLTMPSSQVWILFHFVTSKVYINSLLAMLNFRDTYHGRGLNEGENTSQSELKSNSRNRQDSCGVQLSVIATETKRTATMTIDLEPVQSRDGGDDEDDEAQKSDADELERASRKSGSAY